MPEPKSYVYDAASEAEANKSYGVIESTGSNYPTGYPTVITNSTSWFDFVTVTSLTSVSGADFEQASNGAIRCLKAGKYTLRAVFSSGGATSGMFYIPKINGVEIAGDGSYNVPLSGAVSGMYIEYDLDLVVGDVVNIAMKNIAATNNMNSYSFRLALVGK